MSRTRDLAWLLLLSLAAGAAALSARSRHRGAPVEAAPHAAAAANAVAVRRRPVPPPPRPREVGEALRRVFGDAVTIDPARAVAGDFNGDGSEDVAAVARAGPGMLARVNDELANWTLQDAAAPRPARVTVGQADVLLAVVHGHGPGGWRNPEARQSYLVRNSPARPRAVEDGRGLAHAGSPRLRGHVIVDAMPGRAGFLYWSGSRYVWASLPAPVASP